MTFYMKLALRVILKVTRPAARIAKAAAAAVLDFALKMAVFLLLSAAIVAERLARKIDDKRTKPAE